MNCFYCDKSIDLVKDHYARSVTHNVYMHLKCWDKYERLLQAGKVTKLYNKDELRSLPTTRAKR